jgi:hypothetical protein
MTPQQAYERCSKEVVPDREYTPQEAGPLLGMHPYHMLRQWVPHKLPARKANVVTAFGVARPRYFIKGSDLIDFARWRAEQVEPHSGVIAKAKSGNAKLGGAAITIVAKQSCPETCPFKANGCYAEHDSGVHHWNRISAGAADKSPLELARAEAKAIDELPGDRDLRLHVAGDSTTEEGTRLIATACAKYVFRGKWKHGTDVSVWAYTHGWRTVPRDAWGSVSVLASCETPEDVKLARSRGYAAAMVVPRFEGESAYEHGEVTVIPCPQQTRERTCTQCRLCMNAERLHKSSLVIGFALHGGGTNKARFALSKRKSLPMVAA